LEVLGLLKKYNIHYVFAGHYHRNNIAYSPDFEVENITTSAVGKQLGKDQSGFRIVKVSQQTVEHEYFDFESMPHQMKL